MDDIARKISEGMRRLELSYSDLAALTGIPKSALHRYATGATEKIPVGRISAIAAALHMSPAELVGWAGQVEDKQNQHGR